MPNKDADDKDRESRQGEDDEKKSKDERDDDSELPTKKLPEPPGNLSRRGEWFKKRH